MTFIDTRDIPGQADAYVCVGAPHMPLGVGGILRLDTHLSLRTLDPITKLTPEIDTPDEHGFRHQQSGEQVLGLMRSFNADQGTAFLLVTHDDHVARHCDRIVHMVDGVVLAVQV